MSLTHVVEDEVLAVEVLAELVEDVSAEAVEVTSTFFDAESCSPSDWTALTVIT
jgi:hypothetical protein